MAKKQESNFKKAMNELLGEEQQKTENLEKQPPMQTIVKREEAVIPADMVITGNISTKSDMKIIGIIIGDVQCEGDILLQGSVQGNINTGNLTIAHGKLAGDAIVQTDLNVELESDLTGNVTAQNVYSNAKIEGQLKVAGTVELKENALVKGDIIACNISIKSGAKIKGMVTISE